MDQNEFIQQNVVDGQLTAVQAAQLLELAEQGDTGDRPEDGGEPNATPATEETTQAVQASESSSSQAADPQPQDAEIDPANTVVAAKDGKHVIPYERLAQAREGERHWKQQAKVFEQELNTLRAEAQQRQDEGMAPTDADRQIAAFDAAVDAGLDPDELLGDFSAEAIVKGVVRITDGRVKSAVAEALKPFEGFLKQQQSERQLSAAEAHFQALDEAHSDWESVVDSKELADWINQQPSFLRDGFNTVLDKGSSAEVIELLDAYKQATGRTQATPPPAGDVKAAAQKAIEQAQPAIPASLSDIPGGRAGPQSVHESLAQLSPLELSERMAAMSPEQIEAFLNRSA